MIELKKAREHTIDRVFILALLTLFSAAAFLVVFIGAREYRRIANAMSDNYKTRTVVSYLQEKLNQNDIAGSISITSVGDCPAVSLCKRLNDAEYYTYIYCHDGYLWEITVSASTEVKPGDGQKIIEALAFSATAVTDNLLCLTVTDALNITRQIYVSLNTLQ